MICEIKLVISHIMKHFILMADVVKSRDQEPVAMMQAFNTLVRDLNTMFGCRLLSPVTITLGDEFQGVPDSFLTSCELILWLEEQRIDRSLSFTLRYVLHEGDIATPLNSEHAWGMLGQGLTDAREFLQEAKKKELSVLVSIGHPVAGQIMGEAFVVYANIVSGWDREDDYPLVSTFLRLQDYKEVADVLGKTRSQIWKRARTLNMQSYFSIRNIILACPKLYPPA
jgi:hypothetical protein